VILSSLWQRQTSTLVERAFVAGTILCVLACQAGCGKKELDRETALRLVQGVPARTFQVSFESTPGYPVYSTYNQAVAAFQQLDQAGVIHCVVTPSGWGPDYKCSPGSNSLGLTINGVTRFTVLAGTLVPTAVNGVAQLGPDAASAQVVMSFVPSPLLAKFPGIFDQMEAVSFLALQLVPQTFPPSLIRELRQAKITQASFQRYDDGWRLASIQ
jgi:hypothetical protein